MRLLLAWSRKTLSQTIGQFRAGETIGPALSQSATPKVSEARRLRAADTVPVASWPVWLGLGGRGDSDYWPVQSRRDRDYPAAPSRETLSRTIGQSDSESDYWSVQVLARL
jgi:hypothetical protein